LKVGPTVSEEVYNNNSSHNNSKIPTQQGEEPCPIVQCLEAQLDRWELKAITELLGLSAALGMMPIIEEFVEAVFTPI
jgi:hypothetical protein